MPPALGSCDQKQTETSRESCGVAIPVVSLSVAAFRVLFKTTTTMAATAAKARTGTGTTSDINSTSAECQCYLACRC